MENIFLFGASDQGKQCLSMLAHSRTYQVAGIFDPNIQESALHNIPILNSEEYLPKAVIQTGIRKGLICVGNSELRQKIYCSILEWVPDFSFINLIDPSVIIAPSVQMGTGNIILAGTLLQNDVHIGNQVLMGSGCILEHECRAEDFSTLGPGSTCAGKVHIGKGSTLGLGTQVIQGLSIGQESFVGAGSLVLKDIPEKVLAYGRPAAIIRNF